MFRFGFSGNVQPLGVIQIPTGSIFDVVSGVTRASDGRWFASRAVTGRLLEFSGPGTFAVVRPPVVPQGFLDISSYGMVADAANSRLYLSRSIINNSNEEWHIAILDINTRAILGRIPTPEMVITALTLDSQGDLLALESDFLSDTNVVHRFDPFTGELLGVVDLPLQGILWAITEHDGLWYFVNNVNILIEFDPIEAIVTRSRRLPETVIGQQLASMIVDEPLPANAELRCGPIDSQRSNGSFGSLDINDIVGFAGEFVTGHPNADIAEPSGVHEINDVMSYVTIYADGCRN